MENNILEYIVRILNVQNAKSSRIDALPNLLGGLKAKQKKYVKKIGLRKLITNHPNDFAIVDEIVIALRSPILQRRQTDDDNSVPLPAKEEKFTPPSKAAVESIKKDIETSNFCVVCSDNIEVYAIGACFHPICFKCSTKLRVLCNDRHCPVCRTSLNQVAFTRKLMSLSETNLSVYIKDQRFGLFFENQQIRNLHKYLLEHRCPKERCEKKYDDFDDLKHHLRDKHGEYFCDLCVRQCKIFTHERETYSSEELREHEGSGDVNSSNGIKGHPLCPFCDVRYLDKDELFRHLQQHHCSCHLCHEASHIFFADIDEMWNDHHLSHHFACREELCYGLDSAVFRTEEELKEHTKKEHSRFHSTSTKRSEQAITLDVTFGRQAGLQFRSARSSSSGFQLTPVSGPLMTADGYLNCIGRVMNVTSFFGFIERYDSRGNFGENIFFNHEACQIDTDEDLKRHFKEGDRVEVMAVKAKNAHRSKWRAVDVTKVTKTSDSRFDLDLQSVRSRTASDASLALMDEQLDTFDALDADGSFPALPAESQAIAGAFIDSPNNPKNWNTIAKTKKPVKTTQPAVASSSLVSSAATRTVKVNKLQGTGVVHSNLEPGYGFITRPNNNFEDNVYFDVKAYGSVANKFVSDLRKELKIGEKVFYELEDTKKLGIKSKSKYRAVKVWKCNQENIETTLSNIQQATADPKSLYTQPLANPTPKTIPGLAVNPRKEPISTKLKVDKTFPAAHSTDTGRKKKNKDKENIAPQFTAPSKVAENHNVVEKAINPYGGLMDLDTFEVPGKGLAPSTIQHSTPIDVEEIFRDLLAEIIGSDKEEILFDFDQELAINEVKTNQIAFVRFAANERPKIYSMLFPPNGFATRHRHFQLPTGLGFNQHSIDSLIAKGTLLHNDDDNLYYVNKSSFYITLRRNENGVPVQLFLHTPFNTI